MASEKIKQVLGIGKDFRPTTLDAHHRMLVDAGEFSVALAGFEKLIRRQIDTNTHFLLEVGRFVTDSPTPRAYQPELFHQADLPVAASVIAVPPPPLGQEGLFDRTQQQEALTTTPPIVAERLNTDLIAPIQTWQHAYDSAKERLGNLEKLRLPFDAARRKLQAVQGAAPEDAKKYSRLVHLQAKYGPGMESFQSLDGQLLRHLTWLVSQAAALKAYLVSLLLVLRSSSLSGLAPTGILLPFPQDVLSPMPSDLRTAQGAEAAQMTYGTGTYSNGTVPGDGAVLGAASLAAAQQPTVIAGPPAASHYPPVPLSPVPTAAATLSVPHEHPSVNPAVGHTMGASPALTGSENTPISAVLPVGHVPVGILPQLHEGGATPLGSLPVTSAHTQGSFHEPATDRLRSWVGSSNSNQSLTNWGKGRDAPVGGVMPNASQGGASAVQTGDPAAVGGILPPTSTLPPNEGYPAVHPVSGGGATYSGSSVTYEADASAAPWTMGTGGTTAALGSGHGSLPQSALHPYQASSTVESISPRNSGAHTGPTIGIREGALV